jgi:hypothetical protein
MFCIQNNAKAIVHTVYEANKTPTVEFFLYCMSNAQFWKVILNVVFCRVYTIKKFRKCYSDFLFRFFPKIFLILLNRLEPVAKKFQLFEMSLRNCVKRSYFRLSLHLA